MARLVEFILAPIVFLVMALTVLSTLCFFFLGWCAGALVAGWKSGRAR